MKKAAESAAKWLTEKAKSNPKLNPIPYPFFKSIANKQIEWASKRGVNLNFDELAEAVRSELLKKGIHVMSVNKRNISTEGIISSIAVAFSSDNEALSMSEIFNWLQEIFMKAHEEKYGSISLTASALIAHINVERQKEEQR